MDASDNLPVQNEGKVLYTVVTDLYLTEMFVYASTTRIDCWHLVEHEMISIW